MQGSNVQLIIITAAAAAAACSSQHFRSHSGVII
jgi:hypothetical protein